MVWQSIFDVVSSLWLVADMALDCVTTAGYYSKAFSAAKNRTDYNIRETVEFPFFVASIIALILPTVIGGIFLWCYMSFYTKKVKKVDMGCPDWIDLYDDCCCSCLCSFSIVTAPLCILGFGIIWIVSPVLHFIQAVFSMFGVQPVGGRDFQIQVSIFSLIDSFKTVHALQGKGLARFWLVVLILKTCEQLLEALPQTLINVIYLDRRWHDLSEWEIGKLVRLIIYQETLTIGQISKQPLTI